MLMSDDTGWNDLGAYSGGGAVLGHPTPNPDRPAAGICRPATAMAASPTKPVSTPLRAIFMASSFGSPIFRHCTTGYTSTRLRPAQHHSANSAHIMLVNSM